MSSNHKDDQQTTVRLSKPEFNLITLLRELKWGTVTVVIKNGEPHMGQKIREDVRFS